MTTGPAPYNHLSQPSITDREIHLVTETLWRGELQGGGPIAQRVAASIAKDLGAAAVLLTTSGTDALELISLVLEVGRGDTVVIPSFTFAGVATAFARTGARLRFVDIEDGTLGIDPASLSNALDDTVKAVVPVHYSGIPFDVPGVLSALAPWPRIALVEDNAHGLFGSYEGKPLGSFGPLSATSFHATKNLTSGEGGAVVINDGAFVRKAQVVAEKGTNRTELVQGLVDKYTWQDIGSSFLLAEPLAALLKAQYERKDELRLARARLFHAYIERLEAWEETELLRLPGLRPGGDPFHHSMFVLLPSEGSRDDAIRRCRDAGIGAAFHYVPLHSAPAASRYSDRSEPCPVASDTASRILRLPFHVGMSESDVDYVCDHLTGALHRGS